MNKMSKTTDSISSTCVLCCGGIKYFAVGPCNHHICLKCSIRMRVLCEQKYCAVCRSEMTKVIATAKQHPYEGIISHKFYANKKAGIVFASPNIQSEFRRLLSDTCTICPVRAPEKSFKELQDHMRKDHELFYCDLCYEHLKVFPSERKTYLRKDLAVHRRKGDGKDTSYRGHPLCEFCDERYFDNDELLRHLRKDHYFCHFCETDGVSHQYYNDYDSLKEHFREQHYLCEEDRCAQEQFTHAFRSSIDLKAHRATAHSSQMSRAQARQMRQLDVEINLPPRISERGRMPDFGRGRDHRFSEYREDGLLAAIQASRETARREIAEKQDTQKPEKENGDARKPKDRRYQAKIKSSTNTDPETSSDGKSRKPKSGSDDGDANKGAVTIETKETVQKCEGKMREDSGRVSPFSKGETKTEIKNKVEHLSSSSSRSTDSMEDENDQKAKASIQNTVDAGCKKKKKKGKTAPDKTDITKESSWSAAGREDERHKKEPSGIKPSDDYLSPKSNTANSEAKSPKIAWTSSKVKDEDFPVVRALSVANVGFNGSAGGLDFYSALQKIDAQPKVEHQPVAMPARRSFKNKDEDFPTLSSIAGILGVQPVQAADSQKPTMSAWSAPKGKTNVQPAEATPSAGKSKKKGKKLAKENQDITKERISKPPPGFNSQKHASVTACEGKTGNPPRLPPGLSSAPTHPPGLTSVSSPLAFNMTSFAVDPPPGFGVCIPNNTAPPGLGIYTHSLDFSERNQILSTNIRSIIGEESKFNMFRSISRRFRENSMTAAEYYSECKSLLGNNLEEVFGELVALLPDVVKQQELIFAQKEAAFQDAHQTEPRGLRGKGRGNREWKSNLAMHQEFPSLSSGVVGNRQPVAAPTWPRVK